MAVTLALALVGVGTRAQATDPATATRAAIEHRDAGTTDIDAAVDDQAASRHADVVARLEPLVRAALAAQPATPADVRNVLRLSHVLGLSYIPLGRPNDLLRMDERALQLARKHVGPRDADTIRASINLGQSLALTGQHRRSVRLLERTLAVAESVLPESDPLLSRLHMAKAYAHAGVDENDAALRHDRKAVELRRRWLGPDHADVISSLNNLSSSLAMVERFEESLEIAEQVYAWRVQHLGLTHHQTLTATTGLAESYLSAKRPSDALRLARQALDLRRRHYGPTVPDTLVTYQVTFEALWQTGQHDEALALAKQAVDAIEHRRRLAGFSSAERQALHSVFALDLHIYARRHGQAGTAYWPQGLVLAERARARTLLETMAQLDAKRRATLSADARSRLDTLEGERAQLTIAAAQAWQGGLDRQAEAAAAQERLQGVEADIAALLHAGASSQVDATLASGSDDPLALVRAWAARLVDGEVYVSWMLDSQSALHAWTLNHRGTVRFFDLGSVPKVAGLVRDLVAAQRKPAFNPGAHDASRQLSKLLLDPLAEVLRPAQRWLIAPEGVLAFAPLEAMTITGEAGAAVARRAISRVQSLDVLAALRQREREYALLPQRHDLLAMGDPDYGPASASNAAPDPRGRTRGWRISRDAHRPARGPRAAAPDGATGGSGSDDSAATPSLSDLRWLRLPGTAREVRMVAGLFAAHAEPGRRVDAFTGAQASEQRLRSLHAEGSLTNYRHLLFAAHGYLSDEPATNSVVLSQPRAPANPARNPGARDAALQRGGRARNGNGNGSGSPIGASFRDDGYVSAAEWPGLDLRSDLVVISACDSAAGQALPGEGVLGLPYALAAAGNVHTLLTLWPVHDAATAAFVTEFYRHVLQGNAPALALALTQRAFMKDRRYARPWYWAGFVLYGP